MYSYDHIQYGANKYYAQMLVYSAINVTVVDRQTSLVYDVYLRSYEDILFVRLVYLARLVCMFMFTLEYFTLSLSLFLFSQM